VPDSGFGKVRAMKALETHDLTPSFGRSPPCDTPLTLPSPWIVKLTVTIPASSGLSLSPFS
jgi:hypothetical protein